MISARIFDIQKDCFCQEDPSRMAKLMEDVSELLQLPRKEPYEVKLVLLLLMDCVLEISNVAALL